MASSRARWWAVFGAAAVGLGAASALDPDGIRKVRALGADVERMKAENRALAADNERLAREVKALRSDPAALERAVREELRYVRPGERVYLLEDPPAREGEGR
jgi:cell division protein FtsB